MGKIMECTGKYATKPYYLESAGYRIFSVEELCFFLCENADILERDMVNTELANWLEEECELKGLSDALYEIITSGKSLALAVKTILDETQFVTERECAQIMEVLQDNNDEGVLMKRKKRADYLLRHQRLAPAMNEYERILEEDKGEDVSFTASVYHNIGLAKAQLFLFQSAESYFIKAYEIEPKAEHYRCYAAALRLRLPESDYIRRISEEGIMSEVTLELEHEVENTVNEWMESEDKLFLIQLLEQKEKGIVDCDKVKHRLIRLKEEYRKSMAD